MTRSGGRRWRASDSRHFVRVEPPFQLTMRTATVMPEVGCPGPSCAGPERTTGPPYAVFWSKFSGRDCVMYLRKCKVLSRRSEPKFAKLAGFRRHMAKQLGGT